MIEIENQYLKVEIAHAGAELRSVKHKKNNLDYMWTGDEKYWGRVSPVLFPIVGRLKNDQYTLNDKIYPMSQHGFLRDVSFEIDEQTATSVTFSFESAGNYTDTYPYEFKAIIRYVLKKNSLSVEWEIVNLNDDIMYFSIGAHPAFRLPLLESETLGDYRLHFSKAKGKNVTEYEIKDGLVHEKAAADDISTIPLSSSLFKNDAIIFDHIDAITLKSDKSDHQVDVSFEAFPYVGVWSKYDEENETIAPFVCIEPWYGIADTNQATGNLKDKRGINTIKAGGIFKADYRITFK